jgi:hypothetical protein
MIGKKALDNIVTALTNIAMAHNIPRRYTIEHGSGTMGTSYTLSVYHPDFTHPNVLVLGKTRSEALRTLTGYLAAQQEMGLVIRQKAFRPGLIAQKWLTPEPGAK